MDIASLDESTWRAAVTACFQDIQRFELICSVDRASRTDRRSSRYREDSFLDFGDVGGEGGHRWPVGGIGHQVARADPMR